MPGADPREAAAIVAGELALPHIPELPARGVGADLIGRTAALLIDIPVDHVHRTYRLASTPTSITRRARDFLRWDVDALEEQWEIRGLRGEVTTVKVQACGPFTVAAHAELRGGHKIIRDRGAVRDVAASLAAGVAEHAAEVERRLGVNVVVQLDEPSIGAVIDGTVTPLTRLDPIAPIAEPELAQTLETMAGEIGRPMILHSCAAPRWELLSRIPSFTPSLDKTGIREGLRRSRRDPRFRATPGRRDRARRRPRDRTGKARRRPLRAVDCTLRPDRSAVECARRPGPDQSGVRSRRGRLLGESGSVAGLRGGRELTPTCPALRRS